MRIIADHLDLAFGQRSIFQGVSFVANSGEILGLLGPSGAGKSSILAMIAGHLRPSAGTLVADPPLESGDVQWLIQSTPLLTRRSVLDNVTLAARIQGSTLDEAEAAARVAMTKLQIDALAGRPVHILSGGERQRVAVARTMVARAQVVLADEPTASLDASARDDVIRALAALAEGGALVIVATHDPVVAAVSGQRIVLGAQA